MDVCTCEITLTRLRCAMCTERLNFAPQSYLSTASGRCTCRQSTLMRAKNAPVRNTTAAGKPNHAHRYLAARMRLPRGAWGPPYYAPHLPLSRAFLFRRVSVCLSLNRAYRSSLISSSILCTTNNRAYRTTSSNSASAVSKSTFTSCSVVSPCYAVSMASFSSVRSLRMEWIKRLGHL